MSGFIHLLQQQQQRHRPSLNPVAISHMFLAEGVGGASITSDRGSAPRKGMERFLQPMSEGRHRTRAPAKGRPACRKLLRSLFGGRASETPRHTPRDTSSNQEADHLKGWLRLSQMECSDQPMKGGHESPDNPSSNPEASPSERCPRPAVEREDKRKWRAVEKMQARFASSKASKVRLIGSKQGSPR